MESVTAKEIIKLIEKEGWYEVRQTGSHKHFKHPEYQGIVTIPVHGKKDITPGTLNSILKQSRLK